MTINEVPIFKVTRPGALIFIFCRNNFPFCHFYTCSGGSVGACVGCVKVDATVGSVGDGVVSCDGAASAGNTNEGRQGEKMKVLILSTVTIVHLESNIIKSQVTGLRATKLTNDIDSVVCKVFPDRKGERSMFPLTLRSF